MNMGKEYSSDSEGDGPSERDDRYYSDILRKMAHHLSKEAAEHAACAAVDAAAATSKRRCPEHKFRRHARELATSVDGKLVVVKTATWSAKRIRRNAIPANCLPAAGTFSAPASPPVLLEVDPRAAALEKILRRWYPPALHPGRNLRPISETDGHGGVSV